MKITTIALAVGLALSSVSSMAMDETKNMKSDMKMMDMKMMDKDSDGMISKTEFMNAHEMMFDHMKNSEGMVSVKDMAMMKKNMMKNKMTGDSDMSGPNDTNVMGITKP